MKNVIDSLKPNHSWMNNDSLNAGLYCLDTAIRFEGRQPVTGKEAAF
jgi:hypothetical protein